MRARALPPRSAKLAPRKHRQHLHPVGRVLRERHPQGAVRAHQEKRLRFVQLRVLVGRRQVQKVVQRMRRSRDGDAGAEQHARSAVPPGHCFRLFGRPMVPVRKVQGKDAAVRFWASPSNIQQQYFRQHLRAVGRAVRERHSQATVATHARKRLRFVHGRVLARRQRVQPVDALRKGHGGADGAEQRAGPQVPGNGGIRLRCGANVGGRGVQANNHSLRCYRPVVRRLCGYQ